MKEALVGRKQSTIVKSKINSPASITRLKFFFAKIHYLCPPNNALRPPQDPRTK